MEKIIEEISARRAYRALDTKPVPREVQERIMAAAVLAPSCSNKQPWRFLVVDDDPALKNVKDALSGGNYWAKKAPLFVLAVTKPELDCRLKDRRDYAFYDLGLSAMNLILQATREGLTAHPIAGFDDGVLKNSFSIGDDYILLNVIVLGYPGDPLELNEKHQESEQSERSRVPVDEVICRNSWGFWQA